MAQMRPPGKTSKMMSTWTGPRRATTASSPHVYQVQDIVSGKVIGLKFNKKTSLGITEYVQQAFPYLFDQKEYHVEELFRTSRAPNGAYESLRLWQAFSESEKSWEPLATLYGDAPTGIIKT